MQSVYLCSVGFAVVSGSSFGRQGSCVVFCGFGFRARLRKETKIN